MTLRLTPEQDHALTLLASAQGTSKHEAVVRAVVAGLEGTPGPAGGGYAPGARARARTGAHA